VSRVTINAAGLGKRYRLGANLASYGRLSESISDGLRAPVRRLRGVGRPSREELWALKDVSFEVREGEIVGVVGRNGAGKTTLLKVLARITEPTEGRAELSGRVGSLLEVGTGFHPELSGRENIFLNGAILGMSRVEVRSKFDEIVAFSELERFVDTPVKRYSSGMYVRLAFAVAAHLEPEILFVDEVLSVGDAAFQQRCLGRMDEIAHSGRTILFVSHSLAAVSALCTRGFLMESGRIVADGSIEEVLARYVAEVRDDVALDLRDRTDRQGDGRLRFTAVRITGPVGAPRTWDETRFSLFYEADADLPDVAASFSVEGPLGEPLFQVTNRIAGQELRDLPRSGEIRCVVPSIPIAPGRYTINLYSEVNGVLADWIRGAGSFEIVEHDVFGSGRLPAASHGRLVLPHSWSVVREGEPRAAVG
jgi:lipopolysaccharide transport system ATP-binding protein